MIGLMTNYSGNWNKEKQRESNRRSYHKYREIRNRVTRENQVRVREEVVQHYGGKCACCGESTQEFLSIDHINGGGMKHRAEVGNSIRLIYWLRRNDYPAGFRVLCHNCNQATSWGRRCPHELLEDK